MATLCINLSAIEFSNSQKSPETENLPVKARLEASVKPEPKTPEALAEEAKRQRLAAGELGLDIYGMRGRLADAGLTYVETLDELVDFNGIDCRGR